jgi:hypothetical protein
VEARLTNLSSEAPAVFETGAHDNTIAIQLPTEPETPQSVLVSRIERYLRAAGADHAALRSQLTAATARDLLARGVSAEPGWAEIVAAVDRSLAGTLFADGGSSALPTSRGRVALRLAATDPEAKTPAAAGADWSAPARQRRGMRAQDLSQWRPSADGLLRLQVSRPVQGLVACLCWLAVIIVP